MKIIHLMLGIALIGSITAPRAVAQPEIHDVPRGHWAYEAVTTLSLRGIFEGDLEGRFNGNQPITRYEFAVALARLLQRSDSVAPPRRVLLNLPPFPRFSLAQTKKPLSEKGGHWTPASLPRF